MQQHLDILKDIRKNGALVSGRNGSTTAVFGRSSRYTDVAEQFPVITTKRIPLQVVLAELLCFVRGESDVREFKKLGCNIWDLNAYSDYWKASPKYREHYLGRIYGVQWRDWIGYSDTQGMLQVDQLKRLVDGIKTDPYGRRHIVTAWQPAELEDMCLPPCHILFQCNVTPEGRLDLAMYQRSCDAFLGNPFDISSYAYLMLILCHQTGLVAGDLIHHMGSVHIYSEHTDAVYTQLCRPPYPLPRIYIDKPSGCELEDYCLEDFKFVDGYEYQSHEPIKAPMVV